MLPQVRRLDVGLEVPLRRDARWTGQGPCKGDDDGGDHDSDEIGLDIRHAAHGNIRRHKGSIVNS